MGVKDFITKINPEKKEEEIEIKEKDIEIFPFDDGKGNIEQRILIILDREREENDRGFLCKLTLYYKYIGNEEEMFRVLRPNVGGRSYCALQKAPEGYNLNNRKRLSDYFPKEEIKESYTLAELLSKQRVINFRYKSPYAGYTERE